MTGNEGDSVAIVVANPGNDASLTVNGVPTQFVAANDLGNNQYELDFYVPAGAGSGEVIVTTGGVQLDAGYFTVYNPTKPSNPSTPTTPSNPGTPATLAIVSAFLEDANGDLLVSQGDQLTVTFNGPVTVSGTDPNGQLALLVPGDSFGAGATMQAGTSPTDVVVTLGKNPKIKVSGTYDPAAQGAFLSSGIDVAPGCSALSDAQGYAPASGAGIDVASTTLVEGTYAAPAQLQSPRGLHSATLLDDGRVLIVGGMSAATAGQVDFQLENEILDPTAGSFTNVSDASLGGNPGGYLALNDSAGKPIASGRFAHVAVKLLDGSGRVLIAGGHGFEDMDETRTPAAPIYAELSTCFVFDPQTNAFTQTGSLAAGRRDAMAVAYTDGRVLVFGGRDANGTLSSSEIWDPSSGSWSAGPDMLAGRYEAAVAIAPSGLLVLGGMSETDRSTNPKLSLVNDEMLDPTQGSFVVAPANLSQERTAHTATSAGDQGDVLVIGGSDGTTTLGSIERFDAASGSFVSAGSLGVARQRHLATSVEGDVLAAGGIQLDSNNNVIALDTAETVNAQGAVAAFGLQSGRVSHTVTKLHDGRILVLGGFTSPQADIRGLDGVSSGSGEIFVRP